MKNQNQLNKNLLRAYEIWLRTGSKRAQQILIESGIQPVGQSHEHAKTINLCANMSNLLSNIQKNLESIYEVSIPQNVGDFLITDKKIANLLANDSIDEDVLEQLLISSQDGCLDLSLYLDS